MFQFSVVPVVLFIHFNTPSTEMEAAKEIKSGDIKAALAKWQECQDFVMANHPNKLEVEQAADHYEAVGVRHFRAMLKAREKQTTIDKFFSPAGPSGVQAQKRPSDVSVDTDSDVSD